MATSVLKAAAFTPQSIDPGTGTGADDWRVYGWRNQPDFEIGAIFQWSPPTGGTIAAEVAITPLDNTSFTVIWKSLIPDGTGGQTDQRDIQSEVTVIDAFRYVRVRQSAADGAFQTFTANGTLQEVDTTTGEPL